MSERQFKEMIYVTIIAIVLLFSMILKIVTIKKDELIINAANSPLFNPSLSMLSIGAFSNQLENDENDTALLNSTGDSAPISELPVDTPIDDNYPLGTPDEYPEWLGDETVTVEPSSDYIEPPMYENPEISSIDDSGITLADIKQSIDTNTYCLTLIMAAGIIILILKIVSPFFFDKY